jgi:hypothetical protein
VEDQPVPYKLVTCLGVLIIVATGSLVAHHSPILFETTRQLQLEGKVVDFSWTNPHSSIQLDVPNSGGGVDRWGIEMGSPSSLVKAGWKSTTLTFGQHITALVRPLRSGERGGLFISVTLDDGRTLGGRATQ